jgi:ABC-type transporter Mla subunit MlaD
LGEVRSSRIDTNDRLELLNHSFERYAERMVEANTRALINALAEVIGSFNTKLNDQFGQNFRELNLAVGKLVVWQKQYAQQLESLIEQETTTRNNMADACLQFAELVKRATAFAAAAESLRDQLQAGSPTERVKTTLRSAER